jgi:hypothetical protein
MHFIKKAILQYTYYRILDLLINKKKFINDFKNDLNSLRKKYNYKHKTIFIAGLPKSGTTRIENFLYKIPGYVARPLNGDLEIITAQDLPNNAFKHFRSFFHSYIKTHTNPSEKNFNILKKYGIDKIVITYRDPRDIAVSRYFHLLESPKSSTEPYGNVNYNNISKEQGLLHSLQIVKDEYIPWIDGWIQYSQIHDKNVLILTYENILDNPLECFKELCVFYDLPLSEKEITLLLESTDRAMKKGFNNSTSVGNKSTFRNGKVGDWTNHFSKLHYEFLQKELNNALQKIGYEPV